MRSHKRLIRWALLATALLLVLFPTRFALAQSPVGISAIEPAEGQPGQEMSVTVFGYGFAKARRVLLNMEDIEVLKTSVRSDKELVAFIRIPEEAPPGPRTVEVVADFGPNEVFSATLPDGFMVLGPATLPTPTQEESAPLPPPEEIPQRPGEEPYSGEGDGLGVLLLLLGAGVVLLGGAALAVTLTVRWVRASTRKQWEAQATEKDLPKTCQEGTAFVRREKTKIEPGRWRVSGLKVTLYDAGAGIRGETHVTPKEVTGKLDQAARQRLLHGDSEALREKIEEIGREVTALVLAWQSLSEKGKDIYLETHLEGGKAEVAFARYRCAGPPPGRWHKQVEWTVKLKAVDHLPRALRGPEASESQEAYTTFLNGELRAYLHQVVEEAGRLF